ncbi:MAG TPA: thioesterase family protein [Pseudonocardiaceae bacterium]|nr:thioesterase family protein [Pseudonocardiaceae bacterium]
MGVYVAEVRPRWSDMDAFGHVNHANTVTLLEEARVEMLFVEATRLGLPDMARGLLVARLAVDYHMPLVVNGGAVRIELSVRELRAASFTLDYTVHSGRAAEDAAVATAQTLMVPYDLDRQRIRRLTEPERDFLAGYRVGGSGG